MVLSVDQPASSAQTQAVLAWRPVQPGLIADMESGALLSVGLSPRATMLRPAQGLSEEAPDQPGRFRRLVDQEQVA